MSKNILGLIEEVKLYLPNKKFIRLQAKIDTGAHYSAIDKSLAKKLGYSGSLIAFKKNCPKFKINKNNFTRIKKEIKNKYKKDLIKKCPGLVDVKLIPATNGFSIRPYFRIKFSLKGKKIKTKASLVDRAHLKYLFLVGKEDMKGFIINPEKNVYYNL
ncbi:MAG: RimK/LysX family protein [Patescibacteria group bacterium]|jgi:hypothetical protein